MSSTLTRTRLSSLSLAAVLALSGSALAACGADGTTDDAAAPTSAAATHDHAARADLQSAMRGLWLQHMAWTRSTVTAFADDSPGLQAELDRLLRNQADIGAAVAPYYGDKAAAQLTDLLTTHIEQAVPVLTAAKGGDKAGLDAALADWYANAQDIADFLASANPESWPQATVREAMKGHIDMTVGYASAILGGKAAEGITQYDEAEEHMVHLADTLTQGIIAQFPDRF